MKKAIFAALFLILLLCTVVQMKYGNKNVNYDQ